MLKHYLIDKAMHSIYRKQLSSEDNINVDAKSNTRSKETDYIKSKWFTHVLWMC